MQQQSLGNITEHPQIAVSQEEYTRIMRNLRYYQSKWDDVEFMNTNGDLVKRPFNHLPIGRTAAKKIASLVYNEQATITVDETVSGANEYVQSVLLNDRFNKNFERYFESCLALGGLAMRPYVDGDKIKIAFVQAPVFLPMRSNTQDVSSAAIVTKTIKSEGQKNVYYTLIEFHEWKNEEEYTITNELYRSEVKDRVGNRVPLSELYEELDETTTIKGLSRPLFTYLKTAGMNNKDINSPLGLSIFDNAKSTIDFINTTYDEFKWEVKMGQRRVAVPEQTVRTEFNSRNEKVTVTRKFDPNQNVYEKFDTGGLDGSINITDLTTPIRSEDYIKAINEGLSLFEMQIGVSAGMFSFDGKSMKTATEIVSENSDTYQMRNSLVSLVEQSLKELVISICELGSLYDFYDGPIPEMEQISVNLDDGVFTDRNSELEYWTKALASGLVDRQTAIQRALKLTEEEAEQMVKRINNETMTTANSERDTTDIEIYGE